jgi:glucokinase
MTHSSITLADVIFSFLIVGQNIQIFSDTYCVTSRPSLDFVELNLSMIITGDIGGTNARLELHSSDGLNSKSPPVYRRTYPTGNVSSFIGLITQFIADSGCLEKVKIVVCGIPGDVVNNEVDAINIPHWGTIDGNAASSTLGIPTVVLLNDFECAAYALNGLDTNDIDCVRPGTSASGSTKAMIGVGTGLGVAFATKCGDYVRPCASESGWIPLWEISEDDRELARNLRNSLGVDTISFEHVCAGPALVRLSEYLARETGVSVSYSSPSEICAKYDDCPIAQQSVNLVLKFLGRFLSVISLTYKPTGGIYLTGGTMESLAPILRLSRSFTEGLNSHRHPILLNIAKNPSVYIIRKKDVGMWGAREFALSHGKSG